jgi:hypothetical protein
MSSRVGFFRLRFGSPGERGRIGFVPPKSRGHRKPFRLGSQANTGSLSLVSPCGWSAIGIVSVPFRTAYLPASPPLVGRTPGLTPGSARVSDPLLQMRFVPAIDADILMTY